jgi:uncharacterized protein YuzE
LTGRSSHEDYILPRHGYLYIELCPADVDETRDLDENTLLDLDIEGRLCAITIEHASDLMAVSSLSYHQAPQTGAAGSTIS